MEYTEVHCKKCGDVAMGMSTAYMLYELCLRCYNNLSDEEKKQNDKGSELL